MLACIECAKNAGYLQLELEVVADNAFAVRLYESVGFPSLAAIPEASAQNMAGRSSSSCGWSWINKTSAPPKGRALLRKTS